MIPCLGIGIETKSNYFFSFILDAPYETARNFLLVERARKPGLGGMDRGERGGAYCNYFNDLITPSESMIISSGMCASPPRAVGSPSCPLRDTT